MESASRNGAVVPPDTAPEVDTVEMLTAATALRWSRPDLTAALAEHAMEAASAVSDRDGWLVAAGWRVHAVGATGDAREVAAEVLEALPYWGEDALFGRASQRLRLELAVLAHDAGEHTASRTLLDGLFRDGRTTDAALAAEVATARLRCRHDDGPSDPAEALAAWGRVGGAAGETGAATVLLVAAATDRRTGRVGSAVTRAVEGLARLDRARSSAHALSPSPHLAAALAVEWISALIAADRPDESRDGSRPLRERLVDYARPTRQMALLRLTLARVAAEDAPDGDVDAARELERAAHDAAASDAPELEYICRTALGDVHEKGGRLESALESVRLAVVAERRHRSRAARFRTALAAAPGLGAGDPLTGSAPPRRSRPSGSRPPVGGGRADDEPPGRDAASGAVPPPDRRDRAAAGGGAPADPTARTAVLRSVQAASMAHPRPAGGSPRRGPAAADGGQGRGADRDDPPAGAGRSPSSGPAPTERAPEQGASNGADGTAMNGAVTGAGRNPAEPRVNRTNGSGARPDGADGNGANGHASRRPGPGDDSGEVGRPDLNGGAPNSRPPHASGWAPPGVDPVPAAEADPSVTAPMNPWATGVWTAGPPHAPDTTDVASPKRGADSPTRSADSPTRSADSPAGDVPAPEPIAGPVPVRAPVPDPVASALADPEAWLASALADLDRIWGRRPDPAEEGAPGEPDPPAAVHAPQTGCVVVLDLTRGGERLPAEDVASTVRRVARRLAQRLPEAAHLLRDRPDSVSVVLADGDRVAAAEWMHRVVPALVDGLAVDSAVEGAHLRAAVHDAQGVVGAQLLQRLDGGRTRSVRGGTPGRARHAASGDIAADATRSVTGGPAARDGEGLGTGTGLDGAGTRRASTSGSGTTDGTTIDVAVAGPSSGGTTVSDTTVRDTTGNGPSGGDATVRDTTGDGPSDGDAIVRETTVRDTTGNGLSDGDTTGSGLSGGDVIGGGLSDGVATGSGLAGGGSHPGADAGATGGGAGGGRATSGEPFGAAGGESPGHGNRHISAAPASSGVVPPGGVATPGEAQPPPSAGGRPIPADGDLAAGQGRHDEATGRRPYLPDGVVVRPGTGGRRHRRSPDPTPDEPDSDAAPQAARAAQQSTDGLGLADLLAGALAAYRGI